MRLKFELLFFVCCLSYTLLPAQSIQYWGQNAANIGMARTGAAEIGLNALYTNIAGLSELKNTEVIVSGEQRFELSELQILTAGGAIPTNAGTFGIKVSYFGFEAYNEQSITASYARKLMDKLSIGAEIIVLQTRIPEFETNTAATFALGVHSKLSKDLYLGIHLYSPMRVEIAEEEFLPSIYRAGLTYIASKKLRINAELEKTIDFPFRFRGGFDYQFIKELHVRLGYSSEPASFHFGFGYSFLGIQLDAAASYHQVLGFSPVMSLAYQF